MTEDKHISAEELDARFDVVRETVVALEDLTARLKNFLGEE